MNDSSLNQSNVFDIFTGKPITQPQQEVSTISDNHFEYCFILPFSGHFIFSHAGNGSGRCKVVLKSEGSERIHVLVHEPPDTGSTSVTNRIEHIATQIYWGFLQGRDPRKITWTIKYEKALPISPGYLLPIQLYWNGHRFWYHRDQEAGALLVQRKNGFFSSLARRNENRSKASSQLILSPEDRLHPHEAWGIPAKREGANDDR